MREERMAILRMVAEGKITADEAETLLAALGSQDEGATQHQQRHQRRRGRGRSRGRFPKPPKPPKSLRGMGRFAADMEHFAEDLAGTITESLQEGLGFWDEDGDLFQGQFDTSPETVSVEPGTTLEIKTNSGAITLLGSDEPALMISGGLRQHYKIQQSGRKIEVKAKRFGTALTLHVPRTVERMQVKTNLGEITLRNFTNALKEAHLKTNTGNILFETGVVADGKIWLKSNTGLIRLLLSAQSACNLKAAVSHMGEIRTNLQLDGLDRGPGYLKGTLNGGGADVRLVTNTGEIRLLNAEAPDQELDEEDIDIDDQVEAETDSFDL